MAENGPEVVTGIEVITQGSDGERRYRITNAGVSVDLSEKEKREKLVAAAEDFICSISGSKKKERDLKDVMISILEGIIKEAKKGISLLKC